MKSLLLLLLLFSVCTPSVLAQDVIVLKDGNTILSKVTKIGDIEIEYRKFNSTADRIYSIRTSEVMSINFEDGEREVFNSVVKEEPKDNSNSSGPKLIEKPADERNQEILSLYNNTNYKPVNGELIPSDKLVNQGICFFGLTSNSIVSNEDIEISFECLYGNYSSDDFLIKIKNKTSKVIYIDKGNCFRILGEDGFCYFDPSKQTTVTEGSGSNVSLGLGGVTGALGINGVVGQIASGVGVGSNSSMYASTTYNTQRIKSIAPRTADYLSQHKTVQTKKGSLLTSAEYEVIERGEYFYTPKYFSNQYLKAGEIKFFTEDQTKVALYIITYSTDPTFSTYSTISFQLFLREAIGCTGWVGDDYDKLVEGVNINTLVTQCRTKGRK